MSEPKASRLLACLPVFGFAAYPVVFLVGVNAGTVPIDGAAVARALAVAFAIAAALLLLVALAPWDFHAGAAWASVLLVLCAFYRPLLLVAEALTRRPLLPDSPSTGAAFVSAAGLLAAGIVRPWQPRARNPLLLIAAVVLLLGINLQSAVRKGVFAGDGPWRAAMDARIDRLLAHQHARPPERDMYYIVLDGFGRPDVLRSHYGVDLAKFVGFLHRHNFKVPSAATSNYSQTFLSLGSTLNLTYLDDLSAAMGSASADRRPLDYLIDRNALMRAARAAGYRVYAIGSTYAATQWIDAADVCVCDTGVTEFEHETLATTPLAALPLAERMYDRHRTTTLEAFSTLERLSSMPERKFVFAHLVVPHPPFVFDAEGNARKPERLFSFRDGDHFAGTTAEYIEGYREQTRYLVRRLTRLIERMDAARSPAPVIVLHGDHGPGSKLQWDSEKASDLEERMSIFAAYAFPGDAAVLSDAVTPVNIARHLAQRYLGVTAGRLPDASYFSTWNEPYRFVGTGAHGTESVDARR